MATPGSAGGAQDLVIEIDLRDDEQRQALVDSPSFDEYQRDVARRLELRSGDFKRVLVVDSPDALHRGDHVKGLRKVVLSRAAGSVMCLLIGPSNGVPLPHGLPEPDADGLDDPDAWAGFRPSAQPRPGRGRRPGRGAPADPGRARPAPDDDPAVAASDVETIARRAPGAAEPADRRDAGRFGRRPGRGGRPGRAGRDWTPGPFASGWADDWTAEDTYLDAASDPAAAAPVRQPGYVDDRDRADPGVQGRRPGRGGGPGGAGRTAAQPHRTFSTAKAPTRAPDDGWRDAPRHWRDTEEQTSWQPEDRDVALRRPEVFDRRTVATLWVSDGRGVGWGMGGTRPDTLTTDEPGDDEGAAPLIALRDALRQPTVFDRVARLVSSLPEAVAAPGLRAVVGRVDTSVLEEATAGAISQLARPDDLADARSVPPRRLIVQPLSLLLPGRDAAAQTGLRDPADNRGGRSVRAVLRDGLIGRSQSRCVELVDDADSVVKGMRTARVLLTGRVLRGGGRDRQPVATAAGLLADAADRLRSLRDNLADEFEALDVRRGLDRAGRDRLAEIGVAQQPAFITQSSVIDSLRELVHEALDLGDPHPADRTPLGPIAQWLGDLAAELFPEGSRSYVARLGEICPDDLLERLRNPPRFRITLIAPRVLLPVLVVCGLGSLWSPIGYGGLAGPLVGGAMGVLVWLLGLVAGRRLMAAGGMPGRRAAGAADWFLFATVGLIGVAAGCAIDYGLGGPPVPDYLRPLLYPLAVTLAFGWPVVVWRRAALRWRPGIEDGRGAATALGSLAEHVARYEWTLINQRWEAHELANAVRGALLDIRDAVAEYADQLDARTDAPPPESVPGLDVEVATMLYYRVGEIGGVIYDDLIDLTRTVLQRVWSDLERRALDGPAHWVPAETTRLLDVYREHLRLRGIHERPPFGRAEHDLRRAALVDEVWTRSDRVADVLAADVTDTDILQLNSVNDLAYLDVRSHEAIVTRFAPSAARGVLGRLGADPAPGAAPLLSADLEWTEGGQVAGVLRLVGLREGAVRTSSSGDR